MSLLDGMHFVCMADVPDTAPVVPAFIDTHGDLHLICPSCCAWHRHGGGKRALKVGDLASHRVSHCGPEIARGGTRKSVGYYLKVAGIYTPEMHQDAESRARRCWNAHAKGGTR